MKSISGLVYITLKQWENLVHSRKDLKGSYFINYEIREIYTKSIILLKYIFTGTTMEGSILVSIHTLKKDILDNEIQNGIIIWSKVLN